MLMTVWAYVTVYYKSLTKYGSFSIALMCIWRTTTVYYGPITSATDFKNADGVTKSPSCTGL